jgi:hypothetical protein
MLRDLIDRQQQHVQNMQIISTARLYVSIISKYPLRRARMAGPNSPAWQAGWWRVQAPE